MSKGSKSGQSRNDQRSISMNPNNAAYHASANNTSNQGNPNNPAYGSSRGRTTSLAAEGSSETRKQ
jgi:predicted phage tail protein